MCYGGGGSTGAAAMIRYQFGQALEATEREHAAKVQLFKEMMQIAMRNNTILPKAKDMHCLDAPHESSPSPCLIDMKSIKHVKGWENGPIQVVVGCMRASYGEEVDACDARLPLEASCCMCAKVLLCLEEAQLQYIVHYVDLKEKPEWLKSIAPNLSTPVVLLPGEKQWITSSAETIRRMCEKYESARNILQREAQTPLTDKQRDDLWNIWFAVCKVMGLKGG